MSESLHDIDDALNYIVVKVFMRFYQQHPGSILTELSGWIRPPAINILKSTAIRAGLNVSLLRAQK